MSADIDRLAARVDELERERRRLRLRGGNPADLERNRRELVLARWELSWALVGRPAPPAAA
jgi:hypothetical protein